MTKTAKNTAQNKYVIALAARIDAENKKGSITANNLKILHTASMLCGIEKVAKLLDQAQASEKLFSANVYAIKKFNSLMRFLIETDKDANISDAYIESAVKTIKRFVENEREIFTSLDSRKTFTNDYNLSDDEKRLYVMKRGKSVDNSTCDTQSSSNSVVLSSLGILSLLSEDERATFKGTFKTFKINAENAICKALFAKLA